MSKIVSVIIPVFNTADCLEACLDSVCSQTYGDLEILCVDDGSTDASPAVLDRYARQDGRIRIVKQQGNQGVSAARNKALDLAAGEYVYFIDSDDWIDPDYLEKMVRRIESLQTDLIINTSYVYEYPDQGRQAFSTFDVFPAEGGFEPSAKIQRLFPPVIVARLYRRSYLERYHFRFPDVKGGGEDIYFTGVTDLMKERIHVFKGPFYHYRQRAGSVVHQQKKGFHYLENFRLLHQFLTAQGICTDGVKLFFVDSLILDTAEKFDFVKQYMAEIEKQVRRNEDIYNDQEKFLLDLALRTPDYEAFRNGGNTNISMRYLRHKMNRKS